MEQYAIVHLRGSPIKQLARRLRVVVVAIVAILWGAPTSLAQTPKELDPAARARIEQSRASIVFVRNESELAEPSSHAVGFFIRNDLVATDIEVLKERSRMLVTATTNQSMLKVLSSGNYFVPYVLLEKQAEVSPLRLGDSEQVALNNSVYMLGDEGAITAGTVTGTTIIKDTRAFLISLSINSNNKGSPIFNHHGDVIGIAVQSPDGQSAGLALPSSQLAKLKHLGEPGVGVGRGDGQLSQVGPATTDTAASAASRVDEKPVRLRAPTPRYTEAARANKIQGVVTLRVLVGADGEVKRVRVIRGLPDGLTEQAIEAARQAKFKPAMKDGKAVPYWVVLEMEFNIR
jgi:TonB family protein